jgi:hypothetical protein
VTESSTSSPVPKTRKAAAPKAAAPKAAAPKTAAPKAAAPKAAAPKAAAPKTAAPKTRKAAAPIDRHPNLGLAPVDVYAGNPAVADTIRADALKLSAAALEAAVEADPTIRTRYDEAALRRLLRDGELLVDRLATCISSGEIRWLTEYAEWICPIYRRRGVPLGDLGAICTGIRNGVAAQLAPDELAVATRSLDAAISVFVRTSRLGGDGHKRNALWKWLYKGV